MKICQVATGMIPIPNNRWGAVEKVIGHYQRYLKKDFEIVDVKYLNDVKPNEYDIVHIHMANLCLEAKKRGIKYVFSIHDHHVEYHGKGSFIYEQNLEAIRGSLFSITHAPHYIKLFETTDKLFYIPHGVDTHEINDTYADRKESFLMVANNGLAGDYGIDRKGFELGIRLAKDLDLPITIIGAEANEKFFSLHPEFLTLHDKLTTIWNNPPDEIIWEHYKKHTWFLHPSILEAGHPNLTLLEAASSGMKIIATYMGIKNIPNLTRIQGNGINLETIREAFVKSNTKPFEDPRLFNLSWAAPVMSLKSMYYSSLMIDEKFISQKVLNRLKSVIEC